MFIDLDDNRPSDQKMVLAQIKSIYAKHESAAKLEAYPFEQILKQMELQEENGKNLPYGNLGLGGLNSMFGNGK